MEHCHYDLDQIEAGIRLMYRDAPGAAFDDDRSTSECIRRSVDVEVALTRWFFGEVMLGTEPGTLMSAIEGVFVNAIANRMVGFAEDPGTVHPVYQLCENIANGAIAAFLNRPLYGENSPHVDISPVTSGRA